MGETTIENNILNLWSVLKEFRHEKKFCDVRLQVGPELFHAHRFILAAASEYFDAMFDGHFKEKNVGESESIPLQDIDPVAFKEILEFIYTGNATVTDANVCELLQASDFLQLRNSYVKNRCVKFIKKYVETTNQPIKNAWETFSLAVVIKNEILINALSKHILSHLVHFSADVKFSTISFDELNIILNGKLIAPCSEDKVLVAILRWINYSREERSKYRDQLMEQIDFKKVSPDCTAFVLKEYEKRLDRVSLNEYTACENDEENSDTFLAECPVYGSNESLHIYVKSSTEDGQNVDKVYTTFDGYSFTKNFVNMTNVDDYVYERIVALNGRWYLMTSDSNLRISFSAVDASVGAPVFLPSPLIESQYFDWCGLHNNIYLCESFSRAEDFGRSVEKLSGVHVYNCDDNHWLTLPPLPKKTFDNCITIHNHVVYVIGVYSLEGCSKMCAQAYDFQTRVWRLLTSKFETSICYTCCSYEGKVYILGSSNGQYQFFVFDPVLAVWQLNIRWPIKQANTRLQIVPYRNELWLIGKNLDITIYNESLATKWRSLNFLKDLVGDEQLVDAVVI